MNSYQRYPLIMGHGPREIILEGWVIDEPRLSMPFSAKDRFTLAGLLPKHERDCDCPNCHDPDEIWDEG
jgi:hypothetical protein